MSIENYDPQLWADSILEFYEKKLVYVEGCNRDYEGEIKEAGDSVKINSYSDPTIFTVTRNSDIDVAETLDGAQQVLLIDQSKGFNFQIDSIDKAQMKPKTLMASVTRRAGYKLKDTADSFAAERMRDSVDGVSTGADTGNWLDNRTIGTGAGDEDAYEAIVDLGSKLSEDDVDEDDRWVAVPPWYHGMLLKDPRFVSFGTPGNKSALMTGRVGAAAGFVIKVSNNVPAAASGSGMTEAIIAGSMDASTFADQIPVGTVEAYRPERRINADALKGQHLYGMLVARPYALARIDVAQGS
jgi:hypothetical protein